MALEQRLRELGIELPAVPEPVANYVVGVRSGSLMFVSGQIPRVDGALVHPGKLGADVSVEQGKEAARRCVVQALAALKFELGGALDHILRIVKVEVFVASAPGFVQQPAVADGASDLLVEIFGAAGKHARVAMGVAELPMGSCVEITLIAEVAEDA